MISVLINNKRVNYRDDYEGVLKDLIIFQLPHLQYREVDYAKECIRTQLTQFLELIEFEKEALEEKINKHKLEKRTNIFQYDQDKADKRKLMTLKRKIEGFMNLFKFYKTAKGFESKVYEFILSFDKMGLLHGFGFSNKWGDSLDGNSEKESLRKI